jgi:phosphatidylserine synthase
MDKDMLRDAIKSLQENKRLRNKIKSDRNTLLKVSLCLAGAGIFAFLLLLLMHFKVESLLAIVCCVLVISSVVIFRWPNKSVVDLDQEIETLQLMFGDAKEKADKLFKHNQKSLKEYYDQVLQQNAKIFLVGILCIVSGLFICFIVLIKLQAIDQDTRIITAIFGAVSSISVNYVGVLYLKMFSQISKSTSVFHRRLVETHNIHFANVFASDLRNKDLIMEKIIVALMRIKEEDEAKEVA